MRRAVTFLILMPLVGCAAHRSKTVEVSQPLVFRDRAPAAAMVFDAPVARPLPTEALARLYRDPAAFVGYDDTIVTYTVVRTDDRQYLFDNFNDFERQTLSAKVSVSYR
jgi:hypothetical protein